MQGGALRALVKAQWWVQGGDPVPSCSLVVCSEIPPVASTIKGDLMDIKHLINCGCQSTRAFLPFLTFKRKPKIWNALLSCCLSLCLWKAFKSALLEERLYKILNLQSDTGIRPEEAFRSEKVLSSSTWKTEPAQTCCSQILYWFFQGKLSSLKWTWSPLPVPHLLSWWFSSEFQTKAPIPTKRLHLISAGPRICHPGPSKMGPAGSRNLIA